MNYVIEGHSNLKMHLAVNIVHLLATIGAVIETAREIVGWMLG